MRLSHDAAYGAAVSSAPRFTPSILNCTPATATLSDAVAVIATVPDTVALFAGAVTDTVGAVVSAVAVPVASFDTGPDWPAVSTATTR